jgi:hypothetical protein
MELNMKTDRTKDGMVVLYHAETGTRIERYPVDARGMIACGEYVEYPEQVKGATPADTENPPQPPQETPGGSGKGTGEGSGVGAQQSANASGEALPPAVPPTAGTRDPAEVSQVQPLPAAPVVTPPAVVAPWGGTESLPKVSPTGAPAVYSTAADATASSAPSAPVRKTAARGGASTS